MLLESALADFSTDDSRVYVTQPGSVPFEWEDMPGTPKSPVKSAKLFYQSNLKPPPSRQLSGDLSARHSRQSSEQYMSPRSNLSDMKPVYQLNLKPPLSRQVSGELNVSLSKLSSSSDSPRTKSPRGSQMLSPRRLDLSRSSPQLQVDVNLGSTWSPCSTPKHRSLSSGADENLLNANMSFTGEAGAVPFVWEVQPGKSRSPPPSIEIPQQSGSSTPKHRTLNSAADENLLHDNMSFTGEELAVPFTWEAHPGKPKFQKDKSIRGLPQLQLPPARMVATTEKDSSASPRPRHLQNDRAVSAVPALKSEVPKEQHVKAAPPSKTVKQPGRFRLGDVIRIRKLESSINSRSLPVNRSKKVESSINSRSLPVNRSKKVESSINSRSLPVNRSKKVDDAFVSAESEFRYHEERSPVSTLDRLPSPPTNSSGSFGSPSIRSPHIGSPAPQDSRVYSAAVRPRFASFSSSSAQSSPRFSTSSSARYMGHCLVQLQAALATDPENSKRFEDSFVELDTFIETEEPENFVRTPVHLSRSGRDHQVWAPGEQERENDSDRDNNVDDRSKPSSSNATSLARTDSESSGTSFISRPIRRSLNTPRLREEEYSLEDRRFLSDHPSLWVASQREDAVCSTSNSPCSTFGRHEEVFWDDQQADLTLDRADEVVRGAADGLRFTYSPVSSAFVFSRSNEEEEVNDEKAGVHLRKSINDTDNSQRFSISLDYGTSEVSHSMARSSDVTELGVSRAESWSKVARGIAYQQAQNGFQDAVPLSFLRRAGSMPLPEEKEDPPSVEYSRGYVDATESRFIHKRPSKKSGLATCLPFRSFIKNFKAMGSPARSRLGHRASDISQLLPTRTPPSGNRSSY